MENILVNGVTEILKPLVTLISQQITLAWGVKDDLRKLKETLESIQALITSAEEKQANDAAVRHWLIRLKDVIYDVDDVMDEFSYEIMRRHAVRSQLKQKVRALVSSSNPLVFRFKMARKIRAINEKLDEIHKNSGKYMLRNTSIAQKNQTREQRNRLTSSVVDDSIIQGREDAKSDIIKILIDNLTPSTSSSISSQPENISTLSIVGMGGLGKTTVAQMVYKDDSIVKNFEPKAWVCVSDTFDIYKILRDIVESITERKCEDPSNVEVLVKQVKEKLIGKKYLIVLDDLWNDDVGDWEKLKSYLIHGGIGSKILVTTRSQKVAFSIGGPVHDLAKLSDDVCWSIIERKVLSLGGAVLNPEMINIGKDIAEKCDGLPLAVNSLGSLMCLKRNQSYWLSIANNNDLWSTPEHKKVISILKLSYGNLSPRMKQCFSYCCIFPKDWIIHRETLIRLWMAEGFLSPYDGGDDISFEDVGNEYFEYLMWSSFSKMWRRMKSRVKDEESGDIRTCKMHDLVHDLASNVLDCNEFGIAKVIDGKEEVSQARRLRLQFDKGPPSASPKVLSKKLRTIIALNPKIFPHVNSFFRYRRLRILCPLSYWNRYLISGEHEFSLFGRQPGFASWISQPGFASWISKLKHLRYLDVSHCELFPEVSLNHSYNLQTLVLRGCKYVPSWFLSKLGSLKKLRHLDISYSDVKCIPKNIGSLEHLSCLDLSYTPISKLPDSITSIISLRTLKFRGCHSLDGLPRELGALTRLRCLDLRGTSIKVLPESCISNLSNLEIVNLGDKCKLPKEIKNWPKLRIFILWRYGDDVMPIGIERLSCLETLKDYIVRNETEVCGSSNCGIEELGGLDSVEVLGITQLENVRGGKQGAEQAKLKDKQHLRELDLDWGFTVRKRRGVKDTTVLEGLQPHSNLKTLRVEGFSGVKLPKWVGSSNFLPNLVELHISCLFNCEKLPALGMLPFLKVLRIHKMKSIKCLGEDFYYQQENKEEESSSSNTTERSSLFPSLVELEIWMENLEEWVAPPLISSSYSSCFPSLEKLDFNYSKKLRSTPITLFSSLKELRLWGTNDNAINLLLNSGGGEGCLTSLTRVYIWNSPDVIYLPPLGILLQHNTPLLQHLRISDCSNFQGFRDDDDANLNKNNNNNNNTSFRSLHLQNCPALTSLPDLRLWTSLRELIIYKCDKLNKESIPYDLKKSLPFLEVLEVDFIQRDELGQDDVYYASDLINLMEEY